MKTVTIRGCDIELSEKLKVTAQKQGKSINQLTIELLKAGLGISEEKKYSCKFDDLDDLFGRWSNEEFEIINEKIGRERQIDEELW